MRKFIVKEPTGETLEFEGFKISEDCKGLLIIHTDTQPHPTTYELNVEDVRQLFNWLGVWLHKM